MAMRFRKYLLYTLNLVIFSTSILACNAQKDVTERRNLMIPKKSEMPRNSRYSEPERKKAYKVKSKRNKNKSLF
jgi:hypothetical protein